MEHKIAWHIASPLWGKLLGNNAGTPAQFGVPALLRFANDAFMDELQQVLTDMPEKLADYLVREESWRDEGAGGIDQVSGGPVKLFQPAHQRFYLVAMSLNCRLPGLPERRVDPAVEEKVFFVIRRLVDGHEFGWFADGRQGQWQPLENQDSMTVGEEQLALFPVGFDMEGHARRLLAGLIPISRRDVYENGAGQFAPAPSAAELGADPLGDPRLASFRAGPLAGLKGLAKSENLAAGQAREIFAFALLDLAEFLDVELHEVWQAVQNESDTGLSAAEKALYAKLVAHRADYSWRDLLVDADNHRQALLTQEFAVSGASLFLQHMQTAAIKTAAVEFASPEANPVLLSWVRAALPPRDSATAASSTGSGSSESGAESLEATYVIRCVYQRPRCKAFADPVVSKPSRPFQLASFFDSDAPVRPLRIRMPVDTSLKGLKKFPKGVSIELSRQLRRQMDRAQSVGLDGLLNGDSGSSSVDLGMICSFSIPIITICALILLMIIVQLLNIIFWWLPFFRICLPIKR